MVDKLSINEKFQFDFNVFFEDLNSLITGKENINDFQEKYAKFNQIRGLLKLLENVYALVLKEPSVREISPAFYDSIDEVFPDINRDIANVDWVELTIYYLAMNKSHFLGGKLLENSTKELVNQIQMKLNGNTLTLRYLITAILNNEITVHDSEPEG